MSTTGGYEFSQLYHASLVSFSPGSTFIATSHQDRVIIRSTSTLSIVRTFQCILPAESSSKSTAEIKIDQLLWSPNSLYVVAFSSKASTGWLFGLTSEGSGEGGEMARLGGEGVEGLLRVEWGRTGKDVLAWSDHGVGLGL